MIKRKRSNDLQNRENEGTFLFPLQAPYLNRYKGGWREGIIDSNKTEFDNYIGLDILITEIRTDKDMRTTLNITKEQGKKTSPMEKF